MNKISIVVSTYPPYKGGMGNAAARQAMLLQSAGFSVEVVTSGVVNSDEIVDGINVKKVKPLFAFGNAAVLNKINKICKDSDIIILHYPFFGTAELLALRGRTPQSGNGKLVVYYHMDVVGTGIKKLIFKLHRKFILPRIMKCADKILLSSQSYFETSYIKDFKNKVSIVPFSVDLPDVVLSDANEPIALFVGGLDRAHYFKGLDNLIEAWVQVAKNIPDAKLHVVGEGDMKQLYEKQVLELGLDDSVIFHGAVPSLNKVYTDAKVTVLPSIDRSEAFGLVLLESMACGTPAIASNLAGVNSVVSESVGKLVQPKNIDELAQAMTKSLSSELKIEQRQKIRQYVHDNFSDEVIKGKLINALGGL